MKCSYCGKELPENAKYCPNCAEPTSGGLYDEAMQQDIINNEYWGDKALKILGYSIAPAITTGLIMLVLSIIIEKFTYSIGFIALIDFIIYAACVCIGFVIAYFNKKHRSKTREIIDNQFYADKTSICPICGSHSIKIYRKGYNWNEAFWGRMFNLKGSHYTAGMNSNDAMCHCRHCGHEWNTGYDYRKIN